MRALQILVSARGVRVALTAAMVALALAGCGQKGPLVLPSGEAAAGRATLPETLNPAAAAPARAASAPPTGTATPVHTP